MDDPRIITRINIFKMENSINSKGEMFLDVLRKKFKSMSLDEKRKVFQKYCLDIEPQIKIEVEKISPGISQLSLKEQLKEFICILSNDNVDEKIK